MSGDAAHGGGHGDHGGHGDGKKWYTTPLIILVTGLAIWIVFELFAPTFEKGGTSFGNGIANLFRPLTLPGVREGISLFSLAAINIAIGIAAIQLAKSIGNDHKEKEQLKAEIAKLKEAAAKK